MRLSGRRQFLLGAAAVGLGSLGALSRQRSGIASALVAEAPLLELPETLHVLGVQEYFTLAAACECVFPRDSAPGAIDLGVPVYIDQALASHPAPRWAEGFRAGLARLDAQSVSRLGRPFCKAKPADRDSLLAAWEAAVEQQDAAFLRDLVTATLEGAFCDPLYLGNRGARGWASLGFDVDPFAPTRTT